MTTQRTSSDVTPIVRFFTRTDAPWQGTKCCTKQQGSATSHHQVNTHPCVSARRRERTAFYTLRYRAEPLIVVRIAVAELRVGWFPARYLLQGRLLESRLSVNGYAADDRTLSIGPVTYNQERRLLFEEVMHQSGLVLATHFPVVFRCAGRLDEPALAATLDTMCARHDALRTVFAPSIQRVGRHLFVNVFRRTMLFVPGSYEQHVKSVARPLLSYRSCGGGALTAIVREELERGLDYERAPLFRVVVCREERGHTYLILIVSHLIVDGWGVRLIGQELNGVYTALVTGQDRPPSPIPLSPIAFARREHIRVRSHEALDSAHYWRGHWGAEASSCLRHSEIPFATRVNNASGGALKTITLEGNTVRRLQAIARRDMVTEYAVFRTVLVALFHHYTKRKRLGLWANFANRRQAGEIKMIGWCATAHLLATEISSAMTTTDLLRQTAQLLADAQRHAWLPLPAVSQVIGQNLEQAYTRIVGDFWQLDVSDAPASFERVRVDVPQRDASDLSIRLRRLGGCADLVVTYESSRYDECGIEHLLSDAVAAIEILDRRPNASISVFFE